MRNIALLVLLLLSASAHAQYVGGWPYPPPYPAPPPPYMALPQASRPLSIAEGMLQAHNAVRRQVGVPPLVWSPGLAQVAREWAEYLVATHGFSHRPDNRYGENLYMISGGSASPFQVVQLWADEVRSYDIRTNTCSGVCGHYTQLVWSKTRAVGCAVAADSYRQVWVCNYDPPGNYVGFRPY